jgi:sulfofructose kinase
MSERRFDVVGLGQCCLDVLTTVDAYPPPDTKCEYADLLVQGGGPVGTALVALSRWGLSTAMVGVVGDDEFGPMIRRSLEDEGVDATALIVRPGGSSQFAFVVAEPGVGRRTVFWRRPTGAPPDPDEIDWSHAQAARVFHTDGLFADAALAGCRIARAAGVTVVVDAGSLREGMLDIARAADHFVASEKFARELVGGDDPRGACRRLAELGPSVVGVTLGSRGYVAMTNGRLFERPAYRVDAVDTTGCGDLFHAGLSYGIARGWSPEKSLDFAAWAAAMVARSLGGRSGIPAAGDYPGDGG